MPDRCHGSCRRHHAERPASGIWGFRQALGAERAVFPLELRELDFSIGLVVNSTPDDRSPTMDPHDRHTRSTPHDRPPRSTPRSTPTIEPHYRPFQDRPPQSTTAESRHVSAPSRSRTRSKEKGALRVPCPHVAPMFCLSRCGSSPPPRRKTRRCSARSSRRTPRTRRAPLSRLARAPIAHPRS